VSDSDVASDDADRRQMTPIEWSCIRLAVTHFVTELVLEDEAFQTN
jgi:hypothetical protein